MKQFTCLNCGIVFASSRYRKCCSKKCSKARLQRNYRAGVTIRPRNECILNEMVSCTAHDCDTCGWNPKVSRKRLAAITHNLEGV